MQLYRRRLTYQLNWMEVAALDSLPGIAWPSNDPNGSLQRRSRLSADWEYSHCRCSQIPSVRHATDRCLHERMSRYKIAFQGLRITFGMLHDNIDSVYLSLEELCHKAATSIRYLVPHYPNTAAPSQRCHRHRKPEFGSLEYVGRRTIWRQNAQYYPSSKPGYIARVRVPVYVASLPR